MRFGGYDRSLRDNTIEIHMRLESGGGCGFEKVKWIASRLDLCISMFRTSSKLVFDKPSEDRKVLDLSRIVGS